MILTVTANPAVDVAYFVDDFKMGEVHRPVKTVITAGGKGLNVSRVATMLGEKVTAMGFVGGANGAFIKSEAQKLNLRCLFTEVEGETRRNVDIIDSNGTTGEILEQGPAVSLARQESLIADFTSEVKNHDVICASGSLPKGVDSGFYIKLVEIAKNSGKRIIVDTGGKALEDVISANPFMIKPNKDELAHLMGEDKDLKSSLKALYEKGIELPFVTLGGDGGALFDGREFYRFVVPSIAIKNTVGSGDSTVAGVAVGLCRGLSLCDAIRLGMASGMSNAQFEQSGYVSCEAVDRFYKDVQIVKL